MKKVNYPYLEIEIETEYDKEIKALFTKVKKCNLAYKAKLILYPLRENYQNLFIGGGANHIWIHKNEKGNMSKERVGVIYFNPYFGIENSDFAK